MKKIFSALFLLISLNVITFSQKKDTDARRADFNGTWVLEKDGNSYGINKKLFEQYLLYVAFEGNELKITKVFVADKKAATYSLSLKTDRSGEKNIYTDIQGKIERTSETHWEKATLVSEYKITGDGNKNRFGGIERYTVSKDGKKLIFESVQTYPVVPTFVEDMTRMRLVFSRKEK